jgi:hypothetical protein
MQRMTIVVIAFLSGLFSIESGWAQVQDIRRQVWEGTTLVSQVDYASGASITVPLTSSTTRVNLYSVGSGTLGNIGSLTFSGTSPTALDLVIGSGALNTNRDTDLSNAANDWVGGTLPGNVLFQPRQT